MEELRSLMWGFDSDGIAVTDRTTDLASQRPGPGGSGLSPSPPGALEQNTPGFVDFVDASGRWVSSGPAVPPAAAFVRRWAIETPADGSPDSLVIQVLVRPIVEDAGSAGRRPAVSRGEARLLILRTRVAR
jgi:hypothetical protein